MKILLTNDDGIEGEGLRVLAEELAEKHFVCVVVPDRNRSAVSHGITLQEPLALIRHEDFSENANLSCFTCSGLPADCVTAGISAIFKDKLPDVVISGINKGANLGTDLTYSGTAAAARHAVLQYGVPGIAASLELVQKFAETVKGEWNYLLLAQFICRNLDCLIGLHSEDVFINVNAPSCNVLSGWRFAHLSQRDYCDTVEIYEAPNGKTYSFLIGGDVNTKYEPECDCAVVEQGFVAISRVYAQPCSAGFKDFAHVTFKMTD